MFEAGENPRQLASSRGRRSDPPMLVNGVTKSVIGFSGVWEPLSGSIGSCGLGYILCLKLSIKLGFGRPLESPSVSESVFEVTLNRSASVSPACSGPGVGRVGVGTGAGVGAGASAGSGAGVGMNTGFDGTGGGETKAVLSAFSLARASTTASLSAFCCLRMRSTTEKSS